MVATATATRPGQAVRGPRRKARPGHPVAPRRPRSLLAWLQTPRGELVLVLALFAFALATRWPYLLRLPHFTDETVEMGWALEIWRGERLPLTASDRYYGPLHAYIVAACFWIFGPSILLPRAIVLVFGALTVALTYFLGRELAGRWAGLLGAALLATAPQHIIVNSHVAWQNSTTPFYTTLCFLLLVRALRLLHAEAAQPPAPDTQHSALSTQHSRPWARGGPTLVAAGFAYGLVLNTHPGTIVLAPALAATVLYTVWRRRLWSVFRAPWPYLAPLAGVVAYGPVLYHNLFEEYLAGVVRVQTRRNYAYEMDPSWASYRENARDLLFELGRMVSNPMRIPEQPLHYLTSPYLVLMTALWVAGLALLLRRGQALPLFALLSTLLIMPRFNHAYGVNGDRYMLTGRYVTFLLPLAFIAVALAALTLAATILRALPRSWRGLPARGPLAVVPAILLPLLVLYPLQPLARYYTHEAAKDPANASFLATIRLINEARGPRTPVLIDDYLSKVDLKDGAAAHEILAYLMLLDGIPHEIVKDPRTELLRRAPALDPHDREALPLVVMMRDRCFPMREEVPLQRISERYRLRELYWTLPSYYAVYRYDPSTPRDLGCAAPGDPQPGY